MANDLKFTLTGDPRSLLDALQRTRAAALKTYGDMRTGVDAAKTAWGEAQGKVQALATALAGVEAPTKKQAAELDRAAAAARRLKTAYTDARDAAALAQQGLRSGGVRAAAGGQHPAQQYAAPGPGQRGFRRGVRLFQLPRRVIHTV